MSGGKAGAGRRTSPEGWALLLLAAFTLAAVVGYATFGRHPEWLPADGFARALFPVSFRLFAQLQIVCAALALFVALGRHARLAWVPALVAVSGASFLAEHLGTGYGFPFGGYGYTGLLGPKLLGRVPILIPLSWFLMAVPSYALADRLLGADGGRVQRLLLATGFLVAWDLALDPAMSHLAPYWVWEESGPYYGMPWINLLGWSLTGLADVLILQALGARGWLRGLSTPWLAGFYGLVLLMPLGMVLAAGLWPAAATTVGAVALLWWIGRRLGSGDAPAVRAETAPFVASPSG